MNWYERFAEPTWPEIFYALIRGIVWVYAGLAFAKYFHGF